MAYRSNYSNLNHQVLLFCSEDKPCLVLFKEFINSLHLLLVEETGDCELANAEFLQAVHCKFVSAIILRNGDKLGACAFVFEATPPALLAM